MSRAVRDLYDAASELPPEDRAELAGMLLESLDAQRDPAAEEGWAAEIERRMADYRAGRVKTLSWQEVRSHLHRSDRRVKGDRSGGALVELLNDSPLGETKIERPRTRIRVRRLKL
jgi:putative addiction module component (TIGR02574 family)